MRGIDMLERLKIILTHPTRIGLFFKDKIYIPILFLLTIFVMFLGVDTIYNVNTKQFTYSQAKSFNHLVQNATNDNKEKSVFNIKYDSTEKKLSGDTHVFVAENFILAVNTNNNYQKTNYICVNLNESGATLYEGFIKLGYVEYKNIESKSFDLTKIQTGILEDNLYFTEFINALFSKVQIQQAMLHTIDNVITTFIFFLGVLVFCFIESYLMNPPIEMKVRSKLVLYDTFSYFFVMLLVAITRITWLQYIGLAIPVIYVNMTFSHIKKIR